MRVSTYTGVAFLVHLLLLAAVQGQNFESQRFNIKGEVLILDVGSLTYNITRPSSILPLTQQACAEACARAPGCNAWTYCDNPQGCSGSCKAYAAKNPPLQPAPNQDPSKPNPAWLTQDRITDFGPWGPTSECQGDAWPYGVCTLKKLANPTVPEFWSLDTTEGWVSGFTPTSLQCTGISPSACQRCANNTKNRPDLMTACILCAANPTVNISMLEAALANASTKPEQCAVCFEAGKSLADSSSCVNCLTDPARCAASCPAGDCAPDSDEEYSRTVIITERTVTERNFTLVEKGRRRGGAAADAPATEDPSAVVRPLGGSDPVVAEGVSGTVGPGGPLAGAGRRMLQL